MGRAATVGRERSASVISGPGARFSERGAELARSKAGPRPARRTIAALLVASVVIVGLSLAFALTSASPASGIAADAATASGWSTTPLNLLGSADHVSTALVKNGHTAPGDLTTTHTENTSEPHLLKGAHTSKFWSNGEPVMLLAPWSPAGFNSGTLLFPEPAETTVHIHLVAVYEDSSSSDVVGDGVAAYFFVDPTHAGNWTMPFVGLGPEVNGTNQHIDSEGNQIFPYSYSPYLIVQWDPANGYSAGFNVYLVHPEPNGTVTYLSIQAAGQLGTTNYEYPSAGDEFDFNASYSTSTNNVSASVVVPADPSASFKLKFSLDEFGFTPSFGTTQSYYFGVAGNSGWSSSGASSASWGALRLSASGSSPQAAASAPVPSSGEAQAIVISKDRDASVLGLRP